MVNLNAIKYQALKNSSISSWSLFLTGIISIPAFVFVKVNSFRFS
jgi:hypothetical protein